MASKGDLVLLELEGRDEEGNIFDSTSGEIAKKLHGKEGPLLIALGTDRLIPGLFDAVGKMQKDEEKELSLKPEKAFGHRKKDLVRIMSLSEFRKYRVEPEPGLVIHVDTDKGRNYGTVKSVSGGRVMVDFNHPLASHTVSYRLKLVDVFTKTEEKVDALCKDSGVAEKWELKDGTLNLKLKEGTGQEHEAKKALLLISLKTRVPGLKKIDIGKQKKEGEKPPEKPKKG